jgi:hypothetical protein
MFFSFSLVSFVSSCPTNLTGGDWRCRKDKRQICTKLGPGVLGAQMETHSSLVTSFLLLFYFASFLYSLKCYFFSLFLKAFLLFYSLKSQSSDLHCPMFPLISSIILKVSILRLADTQQQPPPWQTASSLLPPTQHHQPPHKQPALQAAPPRQQPTNQLCPPSVSLLYTVANKEVKQQFSGGA